MISSQSHLYNTAIVQLPFRGLFVWGNDIRVPAVVIWSPGIGFMSIFRDEYRVFGRFQQAHGGDFLLLPVAAFLVGDGYDLLFKNI